MSLEDYERRLRCLPCRRAGRRSGCRAGAGRRRPWRRAPARSMRSRAADRRARHGSRRGGGRPDVDRRRRAPQHARRRGLPRARSRPRRRGRSASRTLRSTRDARSRTFACGSRRRCRPPRPHAARTTWARCSRSDGVRRAGRGRVRPQLRDRPLHPQHPGRREDRRHDARRARSPFAQAGGQSQSGLHWDMVCDLRRDGEVYADGELVWKAAGFSRGPLSPWSTRAWAQLADVLVGYSIDVQPGHSSWIEGAAWTARADQGALPRGAGRRLATRGALGIDGLRKRSSREGRTPSSTG